jgi:hypothetical protein
MMGWRDWLCGISCGGLGILRPQFEIVLPLEGRMAQRKSRLVVALLIVAANAACGGKAITADQTGGSGTGGYAASGGSSASSGTGSAGVGGSSGTGSSLGTGATSGSMGTGGGAAYGGSSGSGGVAGIGGGAGTAGSGGTAGAGGSAASTGVGGDVLDAHDVCGATRAGAEPRQVNILLVVDKSGSMADTPAGFTSDKWTAMKTALGAALDPVKEAIAFGLEFFPFNPTAPIPLDCSKAGPATCCQMTTQAAGINIPIEPGTTGLPKILSTFGSQNPGGGTPTATALKEALWYFTAGAGAGLQGDKYVLLATDGAPNCNTGLACDAAHCTSNIDAVAAGTVACSGQNCCGVGATGANLACLDDSASITQITALKTAGVSTFVIGIPGSENYANVLDAFAVAGGQAANANSPKYYAVSASGGVAMLIDVFKAITVKLVTTCDLQLKTEPPDPMLLNVSIDGVLIAKAGGAAGINGWTLDSSTHPSTIRITGAPCDNLEAMGATSVQVLYGCPYIPFN